MLGDPHFGRNRNNRTLQEPFKLFVRFASDILPRKLQSTSNWQQSVAASSDWPNRVRTHTAVCLLNCRLLGRVLRHSGHGHIWYFGVLQFEVALFHACSNVLGPKCDTRERGASNTGVCGCTVQGKSRPPRHWPLLSCCYGT